MKKSISILLALSGLLLCSFVAAQDGSKKVYRLGYDTHLFEIYADSTFKYQYVVDTFIDVVSEGKWRSKNGRDLILNSYEQEPPIPLVVERMASPNNKIRQVHIDLTGAKGKEHDYFVLPFTNRVTLPSYNRKRGSQVIETAFMIDRMSFMIIKEPAENTRPKPTIYYQKVSLPPAYTNKMTEEVQLRLHPGESARITIDVSKADFGKRTFTNTPIQIRGKDLTFKDTDSDKVFKLKLVEPGKKK